MAQGGRGLRDLGALHREVRDLRRSSRDVEQGEHPALDLVHLPRGNQPLAFLQDPEQLWERRVHDAC